jgi:aspartyl protease family protein
MDRLSFPGGLSPASGMGHFHVSIQVGHRAGERVETIEALVDTGATYTWIPRDVLGRLGVVPEEEWPFVLADGREVRYPVAWAQISIGERVQPTIVVFGAPGSEPILGVFTLEGFRLAADPVNRRLISVPGLLKGAGRGRSGVRTEGRSRDRRASRRLRKLTPGCRPPAA